MKPSAKCSAVPSNPVNNESSEKCHRDESTLLLSSYLQELNCGSAVKQGEKLIAHGTRSAAEGVVGSHRVQLQARTLVNAGTRRSGDSLICGAILYLLRRRAACPGRVPSSRIARSQSLDCQCLRRLPPLCSSSPPTRFSYLFGGTLLAILRRGVADVLSQRARICSAQPRFRASVRLVSERNPRKLLRPAGAGRCSTCASTALK
jgi:hypothetical protein